MATGQTLTHAAPRAETRAAGEPTLTHTGPVWQAFRVLHLGFVVAPLLAGLDKFLHLLVDWNQYLAPAVANVISANVFMPIVGVVEVVAAIVVLVKPRFGGYLVAAWLVGIIVNLLIHPGSYDATGWGLDLALRDLGLALGALALARLATAFGK